MDNFITCFVDGCKLTDHKWNVSEYVDHMISSHGTKKVIVDKKKIQLGVTYDLGIRYRHDVRSVSVPYIFLYKGVFFLFIFNNCRRVSKFWLYMFGERFPLPDGRTIRADTTLKSPNEKWMPDVRATEGLIYSIKTPVEDVMEWNTGITIFRDHLEKNFMFRHKGKSTSGTFQLNPFLLIELKLFDVESIGKPIQKGQKIVRNRNKEKHRNVTISCTSCGTKAVEFKVICEDPLTLIPANEDTTAVCSKPVDEKKENFDVALQKKEKLLQNGFTENDIEILDSLQKMNISYVRPERFMSIYRNGKETDKKFIKKLIRSYILVQNSDSESEEI